MERDNAQQAAQWGNDSFPDLSDVFQGCIGYANTPGWALIQRTVIKEFGSFENLRSIELGCGLGKVSILFSLLGAEPSLLDYSEKQITAAKYVHDQFEVNSAITEGNLLELPEELWGQYDVSMSFGTAEHFWGDDRQRVFYSHAKVLKPGGLTIIWIPNKYGFLFHFGRTARKLLRRPVSPVDEDSFTRKELLYRAKNAGFIDVQIKGGELMRNDFFNHIINLPRVFGLQSMAFQGADAARDTLKHSMARNTRDIKPWNDFFTYPLVFIGKRQPDPAD